MANQFLESIKASLYNLKTLEIVTAVGSVQYPSTPPKADELHLPDLDTSKPYASMLTKIDLLEGDVTTVMNEQFATGDYTSLRAFHQAREEQGHQIIVNNINAIKELLNLALRPEFARP